MVEIDETDAAAHHYIRDKQHGFSTFDAREACYKLEKCRDMLLIGLTSYGEIDRLSDLRGYDEVSGGLSVIHPTGDAETRGKFAQALRFVDILMCEIRDHTGEFSTSDACGMLEECRDVLLIALTSYGEIDRLSDLGVCRDPQDLQVTRSATTVQKFAGALRNIDLLMHEMRVLVEPPNPSNTLGAGRARATSTGRRGGNGPEESDESGQPRGLYHAA